MTSVHFLREFISERLTAAASEIFEVFEKTIVQYEEEVDRQRRLLLELSWKRPEVKLQTGGEVKLQAGGEDLSLGEATNMEEASALSCTS